MSAEGDDNFRFYNFELPLQKWNAGHDFFRTRVAVVGRAAFEHVANKNILSQQTHRGDDLIKELAGAADKRPALLIFVTAGSFTYKHYLRIGITFAGHGISSCLAQRAAAALSDLVGDFAKLGRPVIGLLRGRGGGLCAARLAPDGKAAAEEIFDVLMLPYDLVYIHFGEL